MRGSQLLCYHAQPIFGNESAASRVVSDSLAAAPGDIRYEALLKELDRVDREVAGNWPLDHDFARNTRFGLFAVPELEGEPYLVDPLYALDRMFKSA